jgi:SUN domain-containing protein 1/2
LLTESHLKSKPMRDFALQSLGAEIVSIGNTKMFDNNNYFSISGMIENFYRRSPQQVLNPYIQPGHCFPFKPNGEGVIIIKLMGKVMIESVSVVHITADESPTGRIDSAPKEFSVYGLDGNTEEGGFGFGVFRYDIDVNERRQTFKVDIVSTKSFQFVKFVIHTNHGNAKMTCLYKLMVHGKLMEK